MKSDELNKLFNSIYSGNITSKKLPKSYYKYNSDKLIKATTKGFGLKTNPSKLIELHDSAQIFAGAKTYQFTKEVEALRKSTNSRSEFKTEAKKVYDKYELWGDSEIETTISQCKQAREWEKIKKDSALFPKLRYSAVLDGATSDICAPLNGIVLPVDDPFWKKFYPLNHYRCRCIVTQETSDVRVTSEKQVKKKSGYPNENMDKSFKNNVGITGMIFSKHHPYYDVSKKDISFAKRNFDLPFKK